MYGLTALISYEKLQLFIYSILDTHRNVYFYRVVRNHRKIIPLQSVSAVQINSKWLNHIKLDFITE